MISILIDPWLTEVHPTASNIEQSARSSALERLCSELRKRYSVNFVRFIDADTYAQFHTRVSNYKGRDRRSLIMFIHLFDLHHNLTNAIPTIEDTPVPNLPNSWLRALASVGNSDQPPTWRTPMLFVPEIRRSRWPSADEITYVFGGEKKRNLVTIESYETHPYCEPDVDPWRLGCVGDPKPDSPPAERRATCRKLPRPRDLDLDIPLSQLGERTRALTDCTCGRANDYYYLPPLSWQPTQKGKRDWRNSAFDRNGVVFRKDGQKETGYVDRDGHIWVWDDEEAYHWEVKTASDDRIAKVQYDGLKLT